MHLQMWDLIKHKAQKGNLFRGFLVAFFIDRLKSVVGFISDNSKTMYSI